MSVSGEIAEFERLWILQFTEAHRRRNGQFGVDFLVCGSRIDLPPLTVYYGVEPQWS
jgi:hypothetical protein